MVELLQVLSILLVAVTMGLALAHGLELPGKLRLPKETYLRVKQIYYPGFTIGGICEPLAILAVFLLAIVAPLAAAASWLTLASLLGLIVMHAAYWILIHPINNFWLTDVEVSGLGADFFLSHRGGRAAAAEPRDWTALRDRWEYSHAIRAVLGLLSLAALAAEVTA